MRRTAFTLMELLIVISIIMILMSMLFVGLRIAREQAAKARTTAAINSLVAELTSYKQQNGQFPDNTVAKPTPSAWDAVFLGKSFDAVSAADWKQVNGELMAVLKNSGAPLPDLLNDGWGQPLHYRPAKYLPYTGPQSASVVAIDSDDPPGRDSFQIWSTGTDKLDQGGRKDPACDDLTSWEKK